MHLMTGLKKINTTEQGLSSLGYCIFFYKSGMSVRTWHILRVILLLRPVEVVTD